MALKSGNEYIESLKNLDPKIYLGDKKVRLLENPTTMTVVKANAKVYDMALDPKYEEVMSAYSPLVEEKVGRSNYIYSSRDDLLKRAQMAVLTSQVLGTCNYRCPGADALTALASTTYEMDNKLGTEYNKRFNNFLKHVQKNDLACSGALTDVKGDRSKRPTQQDPDMYVRVVDKNEKGIIVRGCKINQSGAIASHETIVFPTTSFREGEEDYALSFAVENGSMGMTYISQYTPFTAERALASDIRELGNPEYGVRETSMVVFEDVFIPWERVFMCGEVKFTRKAVERFTRSHRMNCGGACKSGFADLMIGAAQSIAEYLGIENASHVRDKITEMIRIRETSYACAIAAAVSGEEEPKGSGVYIPNEMYGNVAKVNSIYGFWDLMEMVGDIAGGLSVTAPSERGFKNPEISSYLEKYLKAAAPADKRLRITKFIQNWIAGLHGAGTWHGAGPLQTQKMAIYRDFDLENAKKMAKELAGISEKEESRAW